MKKLIHVSFTEYEASMLQELLEREGYRSTSEVIRFAVRDFYDRRFSRHKAKVVQEELSPGQLCASMGGEVFEEKGVEYCRIVEGAVTTDKPLSTLKV